MNLINLNDKTMNTTISMNQKKILEFIISLINYEKVFFKNPRDYVAFYLKSIPLKNIENTNRYIDNLYKKIQKKRKWQKNYSSRLNSIQIPFKLILIALLILIVFSFFLIFDFSTYKPFIIYLLQTTLALSITTVIWFAIIYQTKPNNNKYYIDTLNEIEKFKIRATTKRLDIDNHNRTKQQTNLEFKTDFANLIYKAELLGLIPNDKKDIDITKSIIKTYTIDSTPKKLSDLLSKIRGFDNPTNESDYRILKTLNIDPSVYKRLLKTNNPT